VKRIISLLALIKHLTGTFGLVSLFLAALVRFFLPELTESAIGLLILGGVLLLGFALGAYAEIIAFLLSKRGRYGLNTAAMIFIFVVIMVLANYLGVIKHGRFDVTASGRFTLAPQTINIVKGLKEPISVIGFFPPDAQSQAVRRSVQNLLEEYRYFNRKFSFKFVDPESKPALAKEYKIKRNQTIVFESGSRRKEVVSASEQAFTGAILEVTGVQAKSVYFLTGHGERDINGFDQKAYNQAKVGLIRDLYQTKTLNLTSTPQVPQDCAVLVVAGPQSAFPPVEAEAVESYLKNNGKVLFMLDPNPPAEMTRIISEWGLTIGPGRVLDKGAYAVPDMASPAVFRGSYSPVIITSGLDTSYFPEAAPIVLTDELSRVAYPGNQTGDSQEQARWPLAPIQHENLAILPAVLTTNNSWLEKGDGEKSAAVAGAPQGPFALAAMIVASQPLVESDRAGSGREKLTRLVIIGDSDFASDAHFQNGGNGDLFLNAVNWLAEEEHLIYIRPKQYSFRRLLIGQAGERFVRYSSVGLLPLLALVLGGAIWWRRR